jgi:hypothetical protein
VSAPKGRVPIWRWILWCSILVVADLVFYVLLTPVWLGLRGAAWVAELRARRRHSYSTRTSSGSSPDADTR